MLIARLASLIRPAGWCVAHVDFHNPSDLFFGGFERLPLQHRPRKIRCRRRIRSGNARTGVGPPRPEMTYRRTRNRSVQPPEDGTCSSYPPFATQRSTCPFAPTSMSWFLFSSARRYFSASRVCVTTEGGAETSPFGGRPALLAST